MNKKRIKFQNITVNDDVITIEKNKPLKFFLLEPFVEPRNNFFYIKLSHSLQESTNKLVWRDLDGIEVPHNKASLTNHLGISRQYFDMVSRVFSHVGVMMQVNVYNVIEYYLNPRYVFCGKEIPKFLLDMFRYDVNGIYGEHLFSIRDTMYERDEKLIKAGFDFSSEVEKQEKESLTIKQVVNTKDIKTDNKSNNKTDNKSNGKPTKSTKPTKRKAAKRKTTK